MQYRDCFPGFSHEGIICLKNFKFVYGLGQMRVLFWFSYGLSQMQYRDFFPGCSRERIIFLKIVSLYMIWFNCSTESSFLVFVCYESNAILRLFSLFLK